MSYPDIVTPQYVKEEIERLGLNEEQIPWDWQMSPQQIKSLLAKSEYTPLERVALYYYLKWRKTANDYQGLSEKLQNK